MRGIIIWYSKPRAYGFLEDENGGSRYFQYPSTPGKWTPQSGRIVEFEAVDTPRGISARKLKPVGNEAIGVNNSKTLLKEIASWKLEAKFDDANRYYYHMVDMHSLENGEKCYVIGRKGTGKTAISEYLVRKKSEKRYTEKLTFKNFPFNALYSLSNNNYTSPNQYITLWKYVIYSNIAQMMAQNLNIDSATRNALSEIYTTDINKTLPRKIARWTAGNFSLQILGTGIEFGLSRNSEATETNWIERVEILEDFIGDKIDDSEYYIIFDELDEDYRAITVGGEQSQYISLLTSLFKAVQDVKSIFPQNKHKILPIIFLRDDIYDLITDSDKTKWSDFMSVLDWDASSIRKLITYRISKAINPEGEILPFQESWYSFFEPNLMTLSSRSPRRRTIFEYITEVTHIRPRDYIKYLSACASEAIANDLDYVTPEIIRRVDKAFSNYLRSELEDEIFGILPNIDKVLDLIAHMRKRMFTVSEFDSIYTPQLASTTGKTTEEIIRMLFHFSVIGNQPGSDFFVFRYKNKEARVNLKEPLCIHRGLEKSLQLL